MITRTKRENVTFGNPFSLEGFGRMLPAGSYEVVTDEELIEGLSFSVYRRIATMMLVPAQSSQSSSVEMLTIDPLALAGRWNATDRRSKPTALRQRCNDVDPMAVSRQQGYEHGN
jgi:hypothetical protein